MAQAPAADEFDAAFDEAVVEAEKTLTPVDEPVQGSEPVKKEEPAAKEPVKGAEPVKKEDAVPLVVEKSAAEIATEVATAAIAKAQEASEARALAKATKEAEDAAAAKATKEAEDAAAAREAPYAPSADEAAAMASFQKDFPKEYQAMEARLKAERKSMDAQVYNAVKGLNEKIAQLEKGITPLRTTVEETQKDAHFTAIQKAHADYEEIVKAIPAWIEKMPAHRRIGAQTIYDGGATADVIALFDDYKKENGIVAAEIPPKIETPAPAVKPAVKKPSAEEIASGTPVGSRRAAPSVRGEPDKDDYDSAWAEATKDD